MRTKENTPPFGGVFFCYTFAMDTSPEKMKEVKEYFYGSPQEHTYSIAPELLTVPDNPAEIKEKIAMLEREIEVQLDHLQKKRRNEERPDEYRIEDDALLPQVRDAEKVHAVLEAQKAVLRQKLHTAAPRERRGLLKKIAAFLSF